MQASFLDLQDMLSECLRLIATDSRHIANTQSHHLEQRVVHALRSRENLSAREHILLLDQYFMMKHLRQFLQENYAEPTRQYLALRDVLRVPAPGPSVSESYAIFTANQNPFRAALLPYGKALTTKVDQK